MNEKQTGRRIGLNIEATEHLEKAIKEMKQEGDFIKVNESKLASEVITKFFNKYYKKEKLSLKKLFIDKKAYLQNLIKNSRTNQELIDDVVDYLNGTKKRKRKPEKITQNQEI